MAYWLLPRTSLAGRPGSGAGNYGWPSCILMLPARCHMPSSMSICPATWIVLMENCRLTDANPLLALDPARRGPARTSTCKLKFKVRRESWKSTYYGADRQATHCHIDGEDSAVSWIMKTVFHPTFPNGVLYIFQLRARWIDILFG